MSSTTTTWSTDTNTKSGSATTYTDTVSSLKLVGGEGEDAILRLFADEGDDNADQWRIVSQASNNKLNFMSFASGSWSNVLNMFGSGTAASQYLSIQTGNKLYLDGGGDTYIQESSADVLDIYVGGANMIKITESTTDTVTVTGTVGIGTDNPLDLLHLVGGAATGPNISITSGLTDGSADMGGIIFRIEDATPDTPVASIVCREHSTDRYGINFKTSGGSGIGTTMILTGAGDLGIGLTPTANMDGLSIEAGCITLKERATPTADTNYGKIYTKDDDKLYFQDGAGAEHEISVES